MDELGGERGLQGLLRSPIGVGLLGLVGGAWLLAEGHILGVWGFLVFVGAILWGEHVHRSGKSNPVLAQLPVFGVGFLIVVITLGVAATAASGLWGLAIFAGAPWLLLHYVRQLRRVSAEVYGPRPERG